MSISISPLALFSFPTSPTRATPNLSKRTTDVLLLQQNIANGNKNSNSRMGSPKPHLHPPNWRVQNFWGRRHLPGFDQACKGAVSTLFPSSVASMKNAEHAPYSPSDPWTRKLKSQLKAWDASTGTTRISRTNSSHSFPSVYSQHPRPPTRFLSVRYLRKGSKIQFLVFPGADFRRHPLTTSYPHPRALSLLIPAPATSLHRQQQWTAWRAEIQRATVAKATRG